MITLPQVIGLAMVALLTLVLGYLLGIYHGAKMGIRVFAKDAIILAFRTLEANPDQYAHLKGEALGYPEHEDWIQKAIERKGRRDIVKEDWESEKRRLHDAGIF